MTAEDVRALLRRCRSVPVGNMPRTGTPGKRHWAALPEAYALADLFGRTRPEDRKAVLAAALPDAVCAGILALTGEVGNYLAGWYGYAATSQGAYALAVRAWADLDPFAAEAAATALLEHANKTRREEEKE
jgi:hypothetical protein